MNHGVSVDTTGNDSKMPLRTAACNGHLEVPRHLLNNGDSVHIARNCDLTGLLAVAESGHGIFLEFLKHLWRLCVYYN